MQLEYMANEKRLIDANALRAVLKNEECDCEVFPWALDNAPTVDAVEVVRCKDCLYYTEEKKRCDHQCLDYDVECYDHWLEMEPTDFCSYGERRADNG